MPRTLLLVGHCPSDNTQRLFDAAIRGASHPHISGVRLVARAPLEATVYDVLAASAVLVGTTENFGDMAGLTKDFFERIYYPCLERTQGLPVAVYIRAGHDGEGSKVGLGRIFTGLRWKEVAEPLICRGEWQEQFPTRVEALAMTLAAGLEARIY